MNTETAKLLTVDEIASHLQLCSSSVRKLTKNGVIPSIRLGKLLRYDIEAVRSALSNQKDS